MGYGILVTTRSTWMESEETGKSDDEYCSLVQVIGYYFEEDLAFGMDGYVRHYDHNMGCNCGLWLWRWRGRGR